MTRYLPTLRRTALGAAALALACALLPASALGQRGRVGRAAGPKAAVRQQQRAEKQDLKPFPNRGAVMVRALRDLDLTPQQRRAMREIRDRHDARVREVGRRFLDGRRQVDELLFADAPSVDRARAMARDLSALAGERVTQRTLIELELFQALTPEQRAELRRRRDAAREAWLRRLEGRDPKPADEPPPAAAEPRGVPDADLPDAADEPQDDDLDAPPPPAAGKPAGPRAGRGQLLARMALTPEQQVRVRQLRRQRGPEMRELSIRFRQTQRAVDDALLADRVDADLLRRLAADLGRVETEREMARFEIEAGIRQILTPEQAALLRESRRAAP